MSRSTGPILAAGAVTMVNQSVLNSQPINWKIPIATGAAAVFLDLVEQAAPGVAVGMAWLALITTLMMRINGHPAPLETLTQIGK